MDIGVDTQQGANKSDVDTTYHVDVWLPDAKDYRGLSGASPQVQRALGLDPTRPHEPAFFSVDKINVELKPRFYKRGEKNLVVNSESVTAISFSEDFAKKYQCHSDEEQREKDGNVAVLATGAGDSD